jgi:hypothetical protein
LKTDALYIAQTSFLEEIDGKGDTHMVTGRDLFLNILKPLGEEGYYIMMYEIQGFPVISIKYLAREKFEWIKETLVKKSHFKRMDDGSCIRKFEDGTMYLTDDNRVPEIMLILPTDQKLHIENAIYMLAGSLSVE